jgi:hypothetical protein
MGCSEGAQACPLINVNVVSLSDITTADSPSLRSSSKQCFHNLYIPPSSTGRLPCFCMDSGINIGVVKQPFDDPRDLGYGVCSRDTLADLDRRS